MASVDDLAHAHGVSPEAVRVLQEALKRGGGRQAQFSHPDLGGMGQWSAGGRTQVGDMFNTALKDKVNALCSALSKTVAEDAAPPEAGTSAERQVAGSGDWWPEGLGRPSATGGQNGMRYACFPDTHRVAIEQAGQVTLYDSGEHRISGRLAAAERHAGADVQQPERDGAGE